MQGYRSHAALQGSHCPDALNPCSIEELTQRREGQILLLPLQVPFCCQPVVPVSPGHVRPLHPYPPSRRRRR